MAKNKNITLPLALAVKVELFRRGRFDFITSRDGKNHDKQQQALSILTDSDHVEILYGGAAGGAAADESNGISGADPSPSGGSGQEDGMTM